MVAIFVLVVLLVAVYVAMKRRTHRLLEEQKALLSMQHEKERELLKQQVLTGVSQELLTPITLIISPLQQMVGESLPGDLSGRVQMVLRNAQILLHQVNMLPVGIKSGIVPMMAPDAGMSSLMPAAANGMGQQPSPSTAAEQGAAQKEGRQGTVPSGIDDSNAAEAADRHAESGGLEHGEEDGVPAEQRFTMLMVDDSPDMCRFVRDYFRGEYNVITASNGEQALLCLQENDSIDLVVSDVTMPKMNGLELCKHIKTDLRWSHIPVILLTGRTDEQMEMEGLKLGADDYITKPFNVEMLRLRVKKLVEKKEDRQKQFREKMDVAPSDITITSVDEQFIQHAIKICEEHISDTAFSVEMLGHELSLSRTYLYKKLINITGKGPAEFIRTIRMKRGKQYLEKTSMQITEIATALGYNSPKRFTENFKIEYGVSPSEYLRKYRAENGGKRAV